MRDPFAGDSFPPSFVSSYFPACGFAQQAYVRPMVNTPVDERQRIRLKGNTHPLARPQFDVAAAPADLPMDRMLLVLKRSPEQRAALRKLLDDQQDKLSSNYHKWLTPEQFGQQFGPADADMQAVTSWLRVHGFQVAPVGKGRTMIEFSGNAAQVQEAFHTAIHKYSTNGEVHWANVNDPEIPAALAPVIAGVNTLHNFYAKPQIVISDQRFPVARQSGAGGSCHWSKRNPCPGAGRLRDYLQHQPRLSGGRRWNGDNDRRSRALKF